MADIIPQEERAEEAIKASTSTFLEEVAHVPQQEDQAVGFQKTDSSSGLKETLDAYNPWGDDDSTERTGPSKEPFDLVAERKEMMEPSKEAA